MARSGKAPSTLRRRSQGRGGPWLGIRVALVLGPDFYPEHPPRRRMLVSPDHTLAELAEAIDVASARWDHSHLHLFDLGDSGTYMLGGDEDDDSVGDSERTPWRLLRLRPGVRFSYIYDLGDEWHHDCEVETMDLDPEEVYGMVPNKLTPFSGWGTISDQYGRLTEAG